MAEPLSDRDKLIARIVFRSTLNTLLEMVRCGFNAEIVVRVALDDAKAEMWLAKIARELGALLESNIPIRRHL